MSELKPRIVLLMECNNKFYSVKISQGILSAVADRSTSVTRITPPCGLSQSRSQFQ